MGLKQEMEVAMKLLEKDTHEKQDTLAALRLQLDQVKTLNLQMFQKAQVNPPRLILNPVKRGHTSLCNSTGLGTRGREETCEGCAAGAEDERHGEGHYGARAEVWMGGIPCVELPVTHRHLFNRLCTTD